MNVAFLASKVAILVFFAVKPAFSRWVSTLLVSLFAL